MITEPALARLVETFYARVRQDPLIGPIFEDAIGDWPEHLAKLAAFWSSVMLTSGRYKGRPMPAHLRHADRLTDPTFARWLAIWRRTTDELFPPADAAALQDRAARIAESLQLGIAFRGGSRSSPLPLAGGAGGGQVTDSGRDGQAHP